MNRYNKKEIKQTDVRDGITLLQKVTFEGIEDNVS